jgi:hypothetical protein
MCPHRQIYSPPLEKGTDEMKDELDEIDAALGLLRNLRAIVAGELTALEARRRTAYDYLHPGQLRATLQQIDEGVHRDDGVNPRLYALITSPEVARFKLRTPGIRSLERLRARTVAEREAGARTAAEVWPAPFRLLPGRKFAQGAHDCEPGDVVELTAAQARAFGDLFERV